MVNHTEIKVLIKLLGFVIEKRPENPYFLNIIKKLEKIGSLGVPEVPEYDTKDIEDCLQKLKQISRDFSSLDGGGSLEILENLKRQMSGQLEYLATHKDKFILQASNFEDILKEDVRVKIMNLLCKEQSISLNQAEKIVKGDPRYTVYKNSIYDMRVFANRLKSSYDVYTRIFQAIIQSTATSRKEERYTN